MRMGALWLIGLAATSTLAAPPRPTSTAPKPAAGNAARYLEAAIRMYRAFEFERALQQLERARNSASEGLESDVAIGLYEGIIQLELGREDQAQAAFRTALTLDPGSKLPVSVSPKIAGVFEKAKASIVAENAERPAVVSAPVVEARPVVETKPVVAKPAPARRLPLLIFAPAAAGLAFGATGIVLMVQARERSDALNGKFGSPNVTTAMRYRDEGKLLQALGWVGLGLCGVGVAASAVLLLTRGGDGGRASLTVGPTGVGVVGEW